MPREEFGVSQCAHHPVLRLNTIEQHTHRMLLPMAPQARKEAVPVQESLRPEGMPLLSEKPKPKLQKRTVTDKVMAQRKAADERERKSNATFNRLQALAVSHAQYNPVPGLKQGQPLGGANDDDSEDSGWSDDD